MDLFGKVDLYLLISYKKFMELFRFWFSKKNFSGERSYKRNKVNMEISTIRFCPLLHKIPLAIIINKK